MIKFNNLISNSTQEENVSDNEFNNLKQVMENELIPFNLLTKFLKKMEIMSKYQRKRLFYK